MALSVHATMCVLAPSCPARTRAAVCLRVARPVCVPASTTSAAPCEPACLCANANASRWHRSFCRRWLLAGRAASVKQFTGVQMNEAFENGHVDGTVQTAAHYQKLYQKTIDDKDAAIAALQEEKLQLVGERDRSEWSYKTLKVELKAEYKTMVEAVEHEAAGRLEAMEADRDEAQTERDEMTKELTIWKPERMQPGKADATTLAQAEVLGSNELIECILNFSSNRDKLQFVVTSKAILTGTDDHEVSIGMRILKGKSWATYQNLRLKWLRDIGDELHDAMDAARDEYIQASDRHRPAEFVQMSKLVEHWKEMDELKKEKKAITKKIKAMKAADAALNVTESDESDSDDSEYNLGHMGPEGETDHESDSADEA